MRSGLYLEDFGGENTSDMVGKSQIVYHNVWTNLLTQYLCPWLSALCFCLCRKLQENQESMTSRLEEAEHKAKSLQTGIS